jgi:hypothetical protein
MDYRILSEQEKVELLPKFSVWEKKWIEDGHTWFKTIHGIPSSINGFFYEAYGNSKIAINHIEIPIGYKKKRRTNKQYNDDWVKDFYFNKYIEPMIFEGKLTPNKWIKEVISNWLTIEKVLAMKPNKKVKVLLLDRNLLDTVESSKRKKELVKGNDYKPSYYFKDSFAYIKRKNEIDLSMEILYSFENEYRDFEFEIEYINNNWFPLENGLNIEDEKQWKDYPTYKHIGWRGPMILWKDLKNLPMVTHF